MDNIICVVGPTASGKTAFAVRLAQSLGGEVISCDSMQIYRRMDIGTAKPTVEEMSGIPHHMIDIVEPDDDFSVGKYVQMADGVLQDVHWSVGLFGYFPTYALGNVYAGALHQALRAAVPDLDDSLEDGDATPAGEWLRENVHRHGALFEPGELIESAVGGPVTPEPLLAYLEEKFGAIYDL